MKFIKTIIEYFFYSLYLFLKKYTIRGYWSHELTSVSIFTIFLFFNITYFGIEKIIIKEITYLLLFGVLLFHIVSVTKIFDENRVEIIAFKFKNLNPKIKIIVHFSVFCYVIVSILMIFNILRWI